MRRRKLLITSITFMFILYCFISGFFISLNNKSDNKINLDFLQKEKNFQKTSQVRRNEEIELGLPKQNFDVDLTFKKEDDVNIKNNGKQLVEDISWDAQNLKNAVHEKDEISEPQRIQQKQLSPSLNKVSGQEKRLSDNTIFVVIANTNEENKKSQLNTVLSGNEKHSVSTSKVIAKLLDVQDMYDNNLRDEGKNGNINKIINVDNTDTDLEYNNNVREEIQKLIKIDNELENLKTENNLVEKSITANKRKETEGVDKNFLISGTEINTPEKLHESNYNEIVDSKKDNDLYSEVNALEKQSGLENLAEAAILHDIEGIENILDYDNEAYRNNSGDVENKKPVLIIWSRWKSGSSFFGELLASLNDMTFYR